MAVDRSARKVRSAVMLLCAESEVAAPRSDLMRAPKSSPNEPLTLLDGPEDLTAQAHLVAARAAHLRGDVAGTTRTHAQLARKT